jgi:hypothetical protein
VDVKSVESVEEVMRLAAPCSSEPSAFPCAAGINTSSTIVFTDIAMLDSMVTLASAGAIRALPYGIFALLVTQDSFTRSTVFSDDHNISNSAAYHRYVERVFTDPSIALPVLPWPGALTSPEQHASWLVNAAIDAWMNVTSWHFLLHAHSVVTARTAASFLPNVSSPVGANGRQCSLAALHLDRARYYLRTNDVPQFLAGAWHFIDLASVCMFSALNLQLLHPAHSLIAHNFNDIYWTLMQLDRAPLPEMNGCEPCVTQPAASPAQAFTPSQCHQVRRQGRPAPR